MTSLGMRVRLRYTLHHGGQSWVLRNVTEIHYRYDEGRRDRVAFESDVHQTGITYELAALAEFEAICETEEAPDFWEPFAPAAAALSEQPAAPP